MFLTYLFSSYGEMVNTATCIICYLNIIIISETQLRHITETITFNERPRHLLHFVMWGKAHGRVNFASQDVYLYILTRHIY